MKLNWKISLLAIGAVIITICYLWLRETPQLGSPEAGKRLRKLAPLKLAHACSNDIVGLTRIIKSSIEYTPDIADSNLATEAWAEQYRRQRDNPKFWQAEVEAEFINQQGGIERTNILFRFWADEYQNGIELYCSYDFVRMGEREKERQRRESEWKIKYGLR